MRDDLIIKKLQRFLPLQLILRQERQIKGEVNKMLCEKCKTQMIYVRENSVQGWTCPVCGWEILTTFIDQIHQDMTEYSICTKRITNIDQDKIKVISKISGVNYIVAKQMLEKEGICILKAKAIDIQKAICELENVNIPFEVTPELS